MLPDPSTLVLDDILGKPAALQRCSLLLIDGKSCRSLPLPMQGEVTIGRSAEVDVRLDDEGASRRHARVTVQDGAATVEDLQSQNGTRLNGQPLTAPSALAPGDVITISQVTLLFQRGGPPPRRRLLRSEAEWAERLHEELDRCQRYQTPCALLCLDPRGADPHRIAAALARALRGPVQLTCAQGQILLLLPEVDEHGLDEWIERALTAAAPDTPSCGTALFPLDGCDPDTLLAGARAAASQAAPGAPRAASQIVTHLALGERTVLLAEPSMQRIYDLLHRLADGPLSVLLSGETGTGKELAAAALHHWSQRKGPFIALNCGAIPENLQESELFGHEKGAFTGAVATKIGLLEEAHQGTVFLDEVGEMPPALQVKLLRFLEDRQVRRLGASRSRTVDIRLIAATNRRLEDEINSGRFRRDLYFRLSVATVELPPLRDRPRELALLAQAFLDQACEKAGRPQKTLSPVLVQALRDHDWPGNLRELRNTMDYLASTTPDTVLDPWHLPDRLHKSKPPADPHPTAPPPPGFRAIEEELADLERTRMREALQASGWQHNRAAELIRMPLRSFTRKVKLYGLTQPRARSVS